MTFRGTLQDIRLFVAAYEEKSFTAAAARERSTQSGVSHHIRQLETLLSVKLFIREKVGVTATPAADALYGSCMDTLRGIDEASKHLAPYASGYVGRFNVGVISALAHRIAAPALLRFIQCHPNVRVRIVECPNTQLAHWVRSGNIDFGIGTLADECAGIRSRQLLAAPDCLISRASENDPGPLAGALPASSVRWVRASLMESRHAAIRAFLEVNMISVDAELEIDSALATLDLVGRSDWCTVAPCLIMDPISPDPLFTIRPLRSPDVDFPVMLHQKTESVLAPEADAFVTIFTEVAQRTVNRWLEKFKALRSV